MHKALILATSWLLACAPAVSQLPVTSATVSPVRAIEPTEAPARELALYQEAHALAVEGRCDEARLVYKQYADRVSAFDPASAELALSYATTCQSHAEIDPSISDAVTAILRGDDRRALALLDAGGRASAWREYFRGVALADLRQTDDAVRAFDAAAARPHKLSIAIYGKARAYHDAYRCAEAAAAYGEYAAAVRATNPEDAAMALDYASDCKRVYVVP